jgi:hypothetical protein
MHFVFYLILSISVCGCSSWAGKEQLPATSWISLKDSFAVSNLDRFEVDSTLYHSFNKFHKIQGKRLDSVVLGELDNVYLYSWQERDSQFVEFTVVLQIEDHGVKIVYYRLNQNDSILAATKVAHRGGDAEHIGYIYSQFTSPDTLITTATLRRIYDISKRQRVSNLPGDTSVIQSVFNPDGSISEKVVTKIRYLKNGE